jgi:hypothetical protein
MKNVSVETFNELVEEDISVANLADIQGAHESIDLCAGKPLISSSFLKAEIEPLK